MKKYMIVCILFGVSAVFLPSSCIFGGDNGGGDKIKGKSCLFISTQTADSINSDSSIDPIDLPLINKLKEWGIKAIKIVGASEIPIADAGVEYTNFFSDSLYDFVFFSESPNSGDAVGLRGHPLPLLNLEAWGSAKSAVLRWSHHPKPVSNYPMMTSRIAADAPKELRGGMAPGKEFNLTSNTTDTLDFASVVGFIPTIVHIPIAVLTPDTLVKGLVEIAGADSTLTLPTHLTSACAVEKGTLLADDSTVTQNRAVTIGIHAFSNNYITPEAWNLIRAGMEWILK